MLKTLQLTDNKKIKAKMLEKLKQKHEVCRSNHYAEIKKTIQITYDK